VNVALGLVKSTALYLVLSLAVCIWGLRVEFADVASAVDEPTSFADWFLFSGYWALYVLVAAVAFGAFILFVEHRFKRYLSVGILESVVGGLGYAFVNPFHGLILVWFRRDPALTSTQWLMSRGYSIIHFLWAIALIAYLAAGFIALS
jgi:hypothetical protein